MKKILVSAYTGLGNFVLKTPMIKKIQELYPNSQIDIIAGNSYGTEFILEGSSLIHKTWILQEGSSSFEKAKFFKGLRKEEYDCIILAFDANKKFLFLGSYLAGIKKRIVHVLMRNKLKSIFFLCSKQTDVVPLLPNRHEIDLNYDLLEPLYKKPFKREYTTEVFFSRSIAVLERFSLLENTYIVLQIGAANGTKSAKKWPLENFILLIKKLNKMYPQFKVVTVGDKGDYHEDIKPLENIGLSFVNTAGLTTISEVINILAFSKCIVSHDSGVMHLSNALDKNLIALYGPTDYTRTRPLGKNSHCLYSRASGFASMYNFHGDEEFLLKNYPNVMSSISVDDVLKRMETVINE